MKMNAVYWDYRNRRVRYEAAPLYINTYHFLNLENTKK